MNAESPAEVGYEWTVKSAAHLIASEIYFTLNVDAFAFWEHSALKNSSEDQQRMRANFVAAMQVTGAAAE